jgi:hypothetical protein
MPAAASAAMRMHFKEGNITENELLFCGEFDGKAVRSSFLILAGEHICILQHYLNCALRVPDRGRVLD